jgi:hypothetical protein
MIFPRISCSSKSFDPTVIETPLRSYSAKAESPEVALSSEPPHAAMAKVSTINNANKLLLFSNLIIVLSLLKLKEKRNFSYTSTLMEQD